MERVIQDLGAGVQFMRRRGVEQLTLIGNSGGAALVCLYQSQAECLTIEATPAGDAVALTPDQLPTADGIALAAAHPGRAQLLDRWLDASVVDERDPLSALSELDIYDVQRSLPFDRGFVERLRARQGARHRRDHRVRTTTAGVPAFAARRTCVTKRWSCTARTQTPGSSTSPSTPTTEQREATGVTRVQ